MSLNIFMVISTMFLPSCFYSSPDCIDLTMSSVTAVGDVEERGVQLVDATKFNTVVL